MQIPKRRSQLLQIREDEGPVYVTEHTLERMKQQLVELESHQRPRVVEDLAFARQKGDLSENAEYQDARSKLSRMDSRIFHLKEKLKHASIIPSGASADGNIRLGARVTVRVNESERTYLIVGPQESDPTRGRISHVSPLGQALLGHVIGEIVTVQSPNGPVLYRILDVV